MEEKATNATLKFDKGLVQKQAGERILLDLSYNYIVAYQQYLAYPAIIKQSKDRLTELGYSSTEITSPELLQEKIVAKAKKMGLTGKDYHAGLTAFKTEYTTAWANHKENEGKALGTKLSVEATSQNYITMEALLTNNS